MTNKVYFYGTETGYRKQKIDIHFCVNQLGQVKDKDVLLLAVKRCAFNDFSD